MYLQSQWRGPEIFDSEKAVLGLTAHDEETKIYVQPPSITCASSRPPSPLSSSSHHSPSRSPSTPQAPIRSATPSYHSWLPDRPFQKRAEADLRGDDRPSDEDTGRDTIATTAPSSRTQSVSSEQPCSTWGDATTLVSHEDDDAGSVHSGISLPDSASFVSGGSLPPAPIPGSSAAAPQRRWSGSSLAGSAYEANAAMVTDGFRPGVGLPSYTSRPGNLYHETMKYEAGLKFQNCGPFP